MRFVNEGEPVQVRESDGPGRFKWRCIRKGETINLPRKVGLAYGLKKASILGIPSTPKVTEGKIGDKKVETKQFENKEYVSFWNSLLKIDGIGLKTAKDIVKVFKTEKELKHAISHDDELPFRDDVEEKLRKGYGK